MSTISAVIRRRVPPLIIDDLGKTWTTTGSGGITLLTSKFGAGCLNLNGTSGDSLVTSSNLSDFSFPSGTAFCVDFWLFVQTLNNGVLFAAESAGGGIALKMTSSGRLITSQYAVTDYLTSSAALSANTWHHVALTRNASNLVDIWVDGTSRGNVTRATNFTTPDVFNIGAYISGTQENGAFLMDDFRVTRGVPRYTGAFSPPSSEAPVGAGDPFWANVVSLLRFNG